MPARDYGDGAAIFDGEGMQARLYDRLFGGAAQRFGDIPVYDRLATEGRGRILDAACGTGRIFAELAKPGRTIAAFDASATLLESARRRAETAKLICPIAISRQRLETFSVEPGFELIIIGYYGFSYLLTEAARRSCLAAIRRYLAAEGVAVIHLPAPNLLIRDVPDHEIAALRMRVPLARDRAGGPVTMDHVVDAMHYDRQAKVRAVVTTTRLLNAAGAVIRQETATMHYACVNEPEIRLLASDVGLRVTAVRAGFTAGADSELVVTLARA